MHRPPKRVFSCRWRQVRNFECGRKEPPDPCLTGFNKGHWSCISGFMFLFAGVLTGLSANKWMKANFNQAGFYRVTYSDANWNSLTEQLKSNHSVRFWNFEIWNFEIVQFVWVMFIFYRIIFYSWYWSCHIMTVKIKGCMKLRWEENNSYGIGLYILYLFIILYLNSWSCFVLGILCAW